MKIFIITQEDSFVIQNIKMLIDSDFIEIIVYASLTLKFIS